MIRVHESSWRTSVGGVVAAIGVVLAVVLPAIGVCISESKVDELAGAVFLLGGILYQAWQSRDDKVSSEGRRAPKSLCILMLMCSAVSIPACSNQPIGGVLTASADGSRSQGVKNTLVISGHGSAQDYAAESPSGVVANAEGVENYGPVPLGTVSVVLPDGTRLLATVPNDFDADSVSITHPDGSIVALSGVSISTSQVIVARAMFLTQMAPIIASMTQSQRDALIAQYEAQAALGDSFASSVLPIIRAMTGAP